MLRITKIKNLFSSTNSLNRGLLKLEYNIHECVFVNSLEWVFFSIEIITHPQNNHPKIEGGAKVGLQLWVCKTQCLFLYYYSLIIVLIFHLNNCKPTFSNPVHSKSTSTIRLVILLHYLLFAPIAIFNSSLLNHSFQYS